jgi:cytochrome c556
MTMNRSVAAICALTIAFSTMAQAPAPQPKLTAEQIVSARQAAYDMSVLTFASMQIAARDGTDVTRQTYPATALNKWAKVITTLYPTGTGTDGVSIPTHAKPEIWSDRAGFEKAAAQYVAATAKEIEFAKAGDAANFKMQIGEIKHACDNCHENYKVKYP